MISIQQIGFGAGTKVFEEALNAIKFLDWLKNLNRHKVDILGPVEGQGISTLVTIFTK